MRAHHRLLLGPIILMSGAAYSPAAAQEGGGGPVLCKDQPCAVVVDWTRSGGVGNLTPDRRYGHPAQLEERIKARLTERGFTRYGAADGGPRFLLVPSIRNASCDELPGTATDTSCKAITELETRLEGPQELTGAIDLPSRLRNRCTNDQVMPVDRLAMFVADWIIYAVDGKAKGERRPVARC